LAAALAPRKGGTSVKLTPEDWRMLAYYSWETNDEQLVAVKDLPATLVRLARACPAGPGGHADAAATEGDRCCRIGKGRESPPTIRPRASDCSRCWPTRDRA
jgi:hypothetical protein